MLKISPNNLTECRTLPNFIVNCFTTLVNERQHWDLRHLQVLSWMVTALVCSQKPSLAAWEPYVHSRAQKAQSYQRRWSRFLNNSRICVRRLYLPLVMAALSQWGKVRLYVALDTSLLWN